MADYSPMMKQYLAIKEKTPNTILLFRLGDFYEMFFYDAKVVSKELELVLTSRDCGQDERAPMCGVPYHSVEGYIAKLVEKGYKVAICEQVEDPKQAKGIVKREVVRIITPGTILESSMLEESQNNYICSMYYEALKVGLCFADISTGDLLVNHFEAKSLVELEYMIQNDISRYSPSEILMNPDALDLSGVGAFIRERLNSSVECIDGEVYNSKDAKDLVFNQFNMESLSQIPGSEQPEILLAMGALLGYLKKTQISGLERMNTVTHTELAVMRLDLNTRRNLELTETMRGRERKGSLLWVLDKTQTSMGKRMIKSWVEQPLMNPAKIVLRQNAVEEFFQNPQLLDHVQEQLSGIHDLERIMTRVVYGSANGRELRSLSAALAKIPGLKFILEEAKSTRVCKLNAKLDPLEDVCSLIEKSITEDPPFTIREGGIIRNGYNEELDVLRDDMQGGQSHITAIETTEKEKTGIPKLKVGYNRVFGYYIEVSNSYKNKVPDSYIRKQTLTNGERYITPELKEIENRILGAKDKSTTLESKIFETVRKQVADNLIRIQKTAKAIAELDVLTSFARVSISNDYTRPTITMNGRLYMKDSRHPVVEQLLRDTLFVPNDVEMDMVGNRISIITGPNMAGKSTYMRQTALLVIMAQMGCFVPATAAEIGIVDGVFTRVGASDDLSAGQSTFMVEMTEVADILNNATKNSLLIFDEIGRGTSTFDGMSIAKAVLEYVHDKKTLGAKTLFATHYHELISLEESLSGVKNYSIAVKKQGDDITFLRRIIRGGADDSYGIEVAKLAGVPEKVIKRAKIALEELEYGAGAISIPAGYQKHIAEEPVQLTMESDDMLVIQKLRNLDVNALTPIESMNLLFELSNLLKC